MIRDFGYGALTDMKTMNTERNQIFSSDNPYVESLTNYPYVFLNPTQSSRTSQTITYRFNMIAMDIPLDAGLELTTSDDADQKDPPFASVLQVQSDCQQYIDDIMAGLRFGISGTGGLVTGGYDPQVDIQLSYNLTPFKERFQDTVAGMTATIEIEVAQPINECIAPYSNNLNP
jgi:hypothetical protein